MTTQQSAIPRVIHVPPGVGHSWWVYGDKDIFKVTGQDTDGGLTVMETVVPPHGGTPLHIHRRESEAFYVLDGQLEVVDQDRSFIADQGSFVHLPKDSIHKFTNTLGRETLMLILFFPAGFEGYLQEAGDPAVEGQPAPTERDTTDLDEAAAIGAKYGLEIAEHRGQG